MSELMDVKEVAKYLKVKEWTIYEWLRNGKIPASRMVGQWRFQKEVIEKWLTQGSVDNSNVDREITLPQDIKQIERREDLYKGHEKALQEQKDNISSVASDKFFVERREEERIVIKEREISIKIVVNFPSKQELISQVLDMSSSGLAFKLKGEKEGILPGTPVKNIVVSSDRYQKTIHNSTIRYCTPLSANHQNDFRVGLQFNIKPFEHSVIRRKLLGSYKIRMQRYGSGLVTAMKWKIAFTHKRKNISSDQLVNFSKFGLAFKIDKESGSSFQKAAILEKFTLSLEGKQVYAGKATIITLEEDVGSIVVRCSLGGYINLEDTFALARSKKESEDISQFIASVEKTKDIETIFKAEIADLRVFLEKTKEKLDAEEASFSGKGAADSREYYKKVILERIFGSVFMRLKHHFYNLWKIVRNFDEEKYNVHKRYFQDQLLHLFLTAPFINRSFNKPLGYAGDYKMIEMVYSSPFEGNSIFAKVLNGYPIQERTSQAVRNRLPYLLNQFSNLLNKTNQIIRVMSVACGPAKEIQELIKSNADIDRLEFTLLDADKEAISYSQERITGLLRSRPDKIKINFVNKDVVQLAQEKDLVGKLGKYDLIYSVGLFDYLTLNLSKRLTKCLYDFLKPNGKLIIGNFSLNTNENKTYMDFILEWPLFYRSEAEMMKFTEKLEDPKKIYFETEDTGLTNFIMIEK